MSDLKVTSTSWHSYPKIFNLGHSAIEKLFLNRVLIEEKVDGSQFSFGKFDGVLKVRSKRVEMDIDAPEQMFAKAVATVKELAPLLQDGWTYRAEFLSKPKHNVLAYDRVPDKHLIIYDINDGPESYLVYGEKISEAHRLGLECVDILYVGELHSEKKIKELLNQISMLGGAKIEGIVIKNYQQFGADGKAQMGKFVSEEFKEIHAGDWRERHPTPGDCVEQLIAKYRSPARWQKAIQHLTEMGQIENSPKDIGIILAEIKRDTFEEEAYEIAAQLINWARPKIERGIVNGFPAWYKELLMKQAFDNSTSNEGDK